MVLPEDHKILKFRDKHTIISRVLIAISVIIFVVAATLMTLAVQRGLKRQAEMTKLIGLAEAQGGDITVARQIFDAIQKVGKLAKLPEDEIPIYATIADVAKLQAQPLFKDAMNGDQILFYSKSQWIYIYRQQSNKIIAQGPFSLPSPTPEAQTMPEPQMQKTSGEMMQRSPATEVQEQSSPSPEPSAEPASPEAEMTNP